MSPTLGPALHDVAVGGAGDRHEPAHGLGDDVVGRPVGVGAGAGAGVTEAADGGVDELRVAGGQGLVADAEPVHHAGSAVLDDHVDRRGEGEEVSRSASSLRSRTIERLPRLMLAK